MASRWTRKITSPWASVASISHTEMVSATASITPSFEAKRGAECRTAMRPYLSIVPTRRIFRCNCITP